MTKRKKSRKKRSKAAMIVGCAWYRPEQWERLREISVDRDDLGATYEEWERNAEANLEKLNEMGLHSVKVDIDVEELVNWCMVQNCLVDGEARAQYATERLRLSRESGE
jgi:hypothetical protein